MPPRRSPIHRHHVYYGTEEMPEWVLELKAWMHRAVTLLERLSPTEENYAIAVNFLHAVSKAVNNLRMRLDTES